MADIFLTEAADIFLKIVNMSISAGWIVLAVLLMRLMLKKAPKWITVLLWGIVAVRLICPFNFQSVLSLIPSAETVSPGIMTETTPHINTGVPVINSAVNPVIGSAFSPEPSASANPLQILIPVSSVLWLIGIAGMLLYTIISYWSVKRKIGTAVLLRDNIYQSENVASPFVLGIIKPKIYLPFYIKAQDMEHVIAHEKAHLLRRDHLWKPLGFLILTVHWFNPLVWLGYVLLCRDIELACDEKVVKELNNEQRADYSQALLTCSVNRRIIAACPLAFGEVGVKDRVKSILNYKKPAFWVILIAVILCIALAVGFLTNPVNLYVYNSRYETGKCLYDYVVSADKQTKTNELIFDITADGKVYKSYPDGLIEELGVLSESDYTAEDLKEAMKNQGEKLNIGRIKSAYEFTDHILLQKSNGTVYLVSLFTDGKIMSVFKLDRTGKCDSSKSDFEKFTWTYSPMLSHTSHSFSGFVFDTEHTHIVASCNNGMMKNLEADKQPEDTTLRFEKGQNVYWTPDEGVIENLPLISTVTFTVFNGDKEIYAVSVIFECIYRDIASAVFEIYTAESDGLILTQKDGALYFAESVSSVGGADENTSTDLSVLKAKYPEFFDVSTDGGLTVYVWQMAENNYRCYLANTALEAISDNSFIYTTGATIDEMKIILSTYDIDREDITIQPIINPISSYYYRIDEAYSAKLKELFWGDAAVIYPVYDGKRIPKLTVFCGAVKTEAITGTLTWTCEAENGKMQTINADSSHPTALMENLLPLALNINTSPENEPVAKLHFDNPPNKISVKGWYVYEDGQTEEFDVQTDGVNVPLNDTKETAVYEIVAEWNSSAKYYGTVRYSFCVVPSANDYEDYIQYGNNDQYILVHKDNAYGSFEQPYSIGQSVRLRHSDIVTSGNTSPNKEAIYDYNVTLEKVLTGETAKLFIKENCTNFDEEEFLFEDNDVYLARVYIEYNDESEISNHKPVDIFLSAVDSEGNYVATENRLEFSDYKHRTENSGVRNWYPVFVPKETKVKLAFVIGSQAEAPGPVAAVHFNTKNENGKTHIIEDIVDSSQFVENSAAAYYNLLY